MTFKFLSLLIYPLCFSLVVLFVALVLLILNKTKCGITLALTSFMWLWVWSTPLANYYLQNQLESSYPPIPIVAVPTAQAIVVLGGAVGVPSDGFPYANLGSAADRVWHAARLYKAGKAPLVVLSGGSDLIIAQDSEASAMAGFIVDLGVPHSALLLEEQSRTTSQNASMVSRLLKNRKMLDILLVTSALHMGRAKYLFEKQGLNVKAVATDHESIVRPAGLTAYLPDSGALSNSARAMKELAGRVVGLVSVE